MKKETAILVGLLALVGVALGARAGRAARDDDELDEVDEGSSSSFAPPVGSYPTREAAPRVPGLPDGPPPPQHAWMPQTRQQWCDLAQQYRDSIKALFAYQASPGGVWTAWHTAEGERLFFLEADAREHCEA